MGISRADITPEQWQRLQDGNEQLYVITDRSETLCVNVYELGGSAGAKERQRRIDALNAGEEGVMCSDIGGGRIALTVTSDPRWTSASSYFARTQWNKLSAKRIAAYRERTT